MSEKKEAELLFDEVRSCRICLHAEKPLPHEPRPVFQVNTKARILLAGQAPGNLVNQTGRPFTDPSGDRLREWLGVTPEQFYDPERFAILPMGFCFPGYDRKGGDLPPRKECALTWREQILTLLSNVRLTLLIGGYAMAWHLREGYAGSVTRTVENWECYAPSIFPLPHPSWRNNAWLKKHPWFEQELLPEMRKAVSQALSFSSP